MYTKEYYDDKEYITFVLGYDLLHRALNSIISNECDNVYEICKELADIFMETDEYNYSLCSLYDILNNWIEENKYKIINYINKDTMTRKWEY